MAASADLPNIMIKIMKRQKTKNKQTNKTKTKNKKT